MQEAILLTEECHLSQFPCVPVCLKESMFILGTISSVFLLA